MKTTEISQIPPQAGDYYVALHVIKFGEPRLFLGRSEVQNDYIVGLVIDRLGGLIYNTTSFDFEEISSVDEMYEAIIKSGTIKRLIENGQPPNFIRIGENLSKGIVAELGKRSKSRVLSNKLYVEMVKIKAVCQVKKTASKQPSLETKFATKKNLLLAYNELRKRIQCLEDHINSPDA